MMNNDQKIINRNIPKEQFEFVQKGQKLYDDKIQGKPISYMQDVWMRFKKNRANVTASIILLTLIICSIIMPDLSGKNYTKLNEKLSFLPPRIPLLEKVGIADGTITIKDKPVDLTKKDEKTGLYLPKGYNAKAIKMDTLTNKNVPSLEKSPIVMGGQAVLRLDYDSNLLAVESQKFFELKKANNPIIEIDVFELDSSNNGKIEVLLKKDFASDYSVVSTITEAGKHKVDLFKLDPELMGNVVTKLRLRYSSDNNGSYTAVANVSLTDSSSDEAVIFDEGYELSQYKIVEGSGSYQRQNSEMIIASFKYDKYVAAFDITHETAFPSSEYDELVAKWGDKVTKTPNPDNPNGWFFSEGFPIREVVKKNDTVVVDGQKYSSYEIYLDYSAYMGYDELPYHLFGTTQSGRDLFALVWVALRTSLLIGVIVTTINVSVGVVYGAIEGYYGGIVDLLMQRFSELMGKVPWLVVLSIMVVIFDPGIKTLIFTMIVAGWVGIAGTTRMQFYRYKGREYVLAARTMGARDGRLIFRHILPNGIGTIITSSVLSIPGVIFTEAALSYLGYGIGHGQSFNILGLQFSGVSIGVLLSDARNFLFSYPYLTVFPSVIISILMITFNMFGNALRDAFNPSLRGVEE